MNAAIEWANGLAGHWARGMWPVLWQTAALAVIVGLIVLCARRMSPALRFWLWMLVPLRLLVMPLIVITLPVLANPPAAQPEPAAAPSAIVSQAPVEAPAPDWTAQPMATVQSHARASIWTWLMAGWVAGVGFFALRLARGWLRMKEIARQARENSDARVRDCAREAAAMLGLRKMPRIMTAADGVSPFVLGFVRPIVVLPAALADHVSPEELRTVLAHEFAHVRRRDALVGWVLAFSDVIYFFNPVVHLVKRAIVLERERACDEQVLALAQAPRAVYARALLSATGLTRPAAARLSSAPVLLESSRHLERRLKSIADERQPCAALSRKAKLVLLAIALLALPGVTLTARSATAPAKQLTPEQLTKAVLAAYGKYETLTCDFQMTLYKYGQDGQIEHSPAQKIDGTWRMTNDKRFEHSRITTLDKATPTTFDVTLVSGPRWVKQLHMSQSEKSGAVAPPGIVGPSPMGYDVLLDRQTFIWEAITNERATVIEDPMSGNYVVTAELALGGTGTFHFSAEVSPKFGFIPVQTELVPPTGVVVFRFVASDLREVKKGLWLPFRVRVDVVNRVVNDFEVKRADVNVNIPDEDIDVVFPEGTIVTDEIAGTRYKVTMVPGEGQSLDRRPLSPQNPAPSAPAENAPSDAEMMKQCDSNLTQIMKGIITYQGLNNDKLPPSLAELFPKYLADPKVLICPADKSPMKIKYGLPCSYRYIGNVPLDIMLRGFIVAYDHAQHYGGRNVLYFDGHSHHASEQDFQKSLAALYEQLKPLLAKPDFPGDRDRVKAFCEDKDFPEEAWPAARPAAPAEKPK